MGEVARPDHLVLAEPALDVRRHLLVTLAADAAALDEQLQRVDVERWVEHPAQVLDVLLEAVEPERRPSAAALHEAHPQAGVALEDTALEQRPEGEHGLERMSDGVPEDEV